MTAAEVAAKLGRSLSWVYSRAPGRVRVGPRCYFRRAEVENYAQSEVRRECLVTQPLTLDKAGCLKNLLHALAAAGPPNLPENVRSMCATITQLHDFDGVFDDVMWRGGDRG